MKHLFCIFNANDPTPTATLSEVHRIKELQCLFWGKKTLASDRSVPCID